MNITELFIAAAQKYPNNIAIIETNRSITYAQLEQEVKETAAYFRSKGITKGDRVLVFVPMSIDLYRTVLALFYLGATAVFLDEWVSKKRLELCCQLADCKGFIGGGKVRAFALCSKELRRIPVKLKLKKRGQITVPVTQVKSNTTALITFTTGSTGTPKAANRTHEFLQAQFDALLDEIAPQVTDIDMSVLPIVLFVNLGVGCTSVIAQFKMTKPAAMDAATIVAQIKQHKVNRLTASPFFIRKLSEYVLRERGQPQLFDQVEKVFTGGAPVFPAEAALYVQAFTKAKFRIVYGSTEAEPISSIDAQQLVKASRELNEGLPVGELFHKSTVRIIQITEEAIVCNTPDELDQITLNEGEVGEIIVAGPHVLKQYFKNEAAFRQNKIVIGNTLWHRTGDSGMLKHGALFLTGRCNQLRLYDEHYVAPFIIENQLVQIAGINIGTLLDVDKSQILVVESKLSLAQLTPQVTNISYDQIVVIDEIPRDARHHSKIDYAALKLILQGKV